MNDFFFCDHCCFDRQRRVAIQHLAEKQNVRCSVVRIFLLYHTIFETDVRKWATLLEDDFFMKQPVTPYRSFRRAEIEQVCYLIACDCVVLVCFPSCGVCVLKKQKANWGKKVPNIVSFPFY